MSSFILTVSAILIMFTTSAQNIDTIKASSFDLQYLVRLPKIGIEHPPVVFFFHGAASNEQDLFTFANQIPDEWLVISIRAPYTISDGYYRWYDVNRVNGKIVINFPQEEESRKKVLKFIDEIIAFYNVDSGRVLLAGFSQGANMASVVSLTVPEKVSGFAIFSGRFIDEIKPFISKSASLKSVKCFLAHGNHDYMLPIAYAMENQQELQRLGIQVTFSEDAAGHSISAKQFEDFLQWFKMF